METQAITFRIPKDLYENLRQESFDTRRPMNELVAEAIGARCSLYEHGGGITHIDGNQANNDSANLDVWEEPPPPTKTPTLKNATETAVWAAWNALEEHDESPVKRIARQLNMEPVDVSFIVYPAERFGRWEDSQEPDLED